MCRILLDSALPKFVGKSFVYRLLSTEKAALAQLVEHSIRNRKVVGSTPMDGSNFFNNL